MGSANASMLGDAAVCGAPKKACVLCVDDDRNVLTGLERQLGVRYCVRTATSAAQALELLRCEASFDAIISDLRMPEIDGLAFLAQARALCPDSARIILTAFGDCVPLADALDRRLVAAILEKPVATQTLFATLDAAIAASAPGGLR